MVAFLAPAKSHNGFAQRLLLVSCSWLLPSLLLGFLIRAELAFPDVQLIQGNIYSMAVVFHGSLPLVFGVAPAAIALVHLAAWQSDAGGLPPSSLSHVGLGGTVVVSAVWIVSICWSPIATVTFCKVLVWASALVQIMLVLGLAISLVLSRRGFLLTDAASSYLIPALFSFALLLCWGASTLNAAMDAASQDGLVMLLPSILPRASALVLLGAPSLAFATGLIIIATERLSGRKLLLWPLALLCAVVSSLALVHRAIFTWLGPEQYGQFQTVQVMRVFLISAFVSLTLASLTAVFAKQKAWTVAGCIVLIMMFATAILVPPEDLAAYSMLADTAYFTAIVHLWPLAGGMLIGPLVFYGLFGHQLAGPFGVAHSLATLLSLAVGTGLSFLPLLPLGLAGMPTRYNDYPESFAALNWWASLGSAILLLGCLLFVGEVARALLKGRKALANLEASTL